MNATLRSGAPLAAALLALACGDSSGQRDPFGDAMSVGVDEPQTSEAGSDDSSVGDDTPTSEDDADPETSGADGSDDSGPSLGCPGGAQAWQDVVDAVQANLDADGIPGAAIAVVCDGVLAHSAGLGTTRAGSGAAVQPSTRFQLASLTKMFTGAAAVAASESGAVDLHADIRAVLPSLEHGGISLHHLLTHTASYPTEFGVLQSDNLVTVVLDNAAQSMWAPPGAVYNYSNPGFSVAGALLEHATGIPFGAWVEARVFAPANMTRATMSVATVMSDDDYAFGHEGSAATPQAIAPDGSYFGAGSYGPMGGAWGSVEDLAQFATMLLHDGGDVLTAAGNQALSSFHTRTEDSAQGYGYGLFIDAFSDPVVLSHGGSSPGFLADFRLVPDQGFGAFVILNADWGDPSGVGDIIEAQYIELDYSGDPPIESSLDDYVGSYVDPFELGTITVVADGAELVATIEGESAPMTHVWEDIYTVVVPSLGFPIQLTFWRGDGPQAEYLVSIWGIATRQ